MPRKTLAGHQQLAVGNLDFADVSVGVIVDEEADHHITPSTGAGVAEESLFDSHQGDVVLVGHGKSLKHLSDGGHGVADQHPTHDVKNAAGLAKVLGVEDRLFDDARHLLQLIRDGSGQLRQPCDQALQNGIVLGLGTSSLLKKENRVAGILGIHSESCLLQLVSRCLERFTSVHLAKHHTPNGFVHVFEVGVSLSNDAFSTSQSSVALV